MAIRGWPRKKYQLIVADPPWTYYKSNHSNQATNHYRTMQQSDIEALPMQDIMHEYIGVGPYSGSVLLLWATCPRLHCAINAIAAWGLHFRGVPFVWVKTRKDGEIMGAKGVRPNIVKPVTELLLAATINEKGRALPIIDEKMRQVILAPATRHSEKPQIVYDRIEELFGDVKRIELFARKRRPGWAVWGDELY